jgi:hypothetical protein
MTGHSSQQPPRRRLSDKVFDAFEASCDEGALEIAEFLLTTLDMLITQPRLPIGVDRRKPKSLAALHAHLWRLRHQSPGNVVGTSKRV